MQRGLRTRIIENAMKRKKGRGTGRNRRTSSCFLTLPRAGLRLVPPNDNNWPNCGKWAVLLNAPYISRFAAAVCEIRLIEASVRGKPMIDRWALSRCNFARKRWVCFFLLFYFSPFSYFFFFLTGNTVVKVNTESDGDTENRRFSISVT